jgi:hypothetical protein
MPLLTYVRLHLRAVCGVAQGVLLRCAPGVSGHGGEQVGTTLGERLRELPNIEQMTCEVIRAELETGFTLAGLAATDYASGNSQRGRKIQAQAQTTYDDALQRIRRAEGCGWAVSNLREPLRKLADRLAGLAEAGEGGCGEASGR